MKRIVGVYWKLLRFYFYPLSWNPLGTKHFTQAALSIFSNSYLLKQKTILPLWLTVRLLGQAPWNYIFTNFFNWYALVYSEPFTSAASKLSIKLIYKFILMIYTCILEVHCCELLLYAVVSVLASLSFITCLSSPSHFIRPSY